MNEKRFLKRPRSNVSTGSSAASKHLNHDEPETEPCQTEAHCYASNEQRQQLLSKNLQKNNSYTLRLLFLNQLVIQQLLVVLLLDNISRHRHVPLLRKQHANQDHQSQPFQLEHNNNNSSTDPSRFFNDDHDSHIKIQNIKKHREESRKKLADPIKLLSYDVLLRVFSFIKTKHECLTYMMVSKDWLEEIPAFTTHVWRFGIKLDGVRHALENSLLHRCLGPHVQYIEIENFQKQQELFNMIKILEYQECTGLTGICMNRCCVQNPELLLDNLTTLTQNIATLTFNNHDGPILPILSMLQRYPHLAEFQYTAHENQYSYILPALGHKHNMMHPLFTLSLTSLTIGACSDFGEPYPIGCGIHCTHHQLVHIIQQAPNLTSIVLSRTGNNIDAMVIHAITDLPFLQELGLFFDIGTDLKSKQDERSSIGFLKPMQYLALYALFAKHAALGRRSQLSFLTLNVVDDTLLFLVGRIPFITINLMDGLNLVSSFGMLQFSTGLVEVMGNASLEKLSLALFDLRPEEGQDMLQQFSHLSKLTTVDFSNCYVNKENYHTFINATTKLQYVYQPLYSLNSSSSSDCDFYEHQQQVTRVQDESGRKRLFWIVHKDNIPIPDYSMDKRRNPYVVMTIDLEKEFEKIM